MSNGVNFKDLCIDLRGQLDRVTAERDAALAEVKTQTLRADAAVGDANEAERRQTAADERADVLDSVVALLIKVTPRNKSSFADKIKAMEILAALKPAEGGGDDC